MLNAQWKHVTYYKDYISLIPFKESEEYFWVKSC